MAAKIPPRVADREGWAADIQRALEAQDLPANVENICATLAVLEQESGYVADPAVPGLGRIARSELERRANAKRIPDLAVDAALRIRATDGRTYGEQLAAARTERELSLIFEDIIGRVPLGQRLFDGWNPVQTGGPMQVSIPFAEANARGYPYPVSHSIRREVFTRRGGMYFGIKHLLDYETPYTRKLHRFADYNAGHYASRNAAFQNAVAIASGRSLALDGDLLAPGAPLDRPGETERAVRELSAALGMGPQAIREALSSANTLAFNDSALFKAVFALAEQRAGARAAACPSAGDSSGKSEDHAGADHGVVCLACRRPLPAVPDALGADSGKVLRPKTAKPRNGEASMLVPGVGLEPTRF